MQTAYLHDLTASFLEFTHSPGILRCLKPMEAWSRARGLVFDCPECRFEELESKRHTVVLLFDHPEVPVKTKPHGRWKNVPGPLHSLTLEGLVFSTQCRWKGIVSHGEVRWR